MKSNELRAYLEQLGAAHGFTLQQLESNRGGNVHPDQLKKGSRGLVLAVVLFVLAVGTLAGGLVGAKLFHDDLRPPVSSVDQNAVYAIGGGGVVVGGFFFLLAGLTLRSRARRRAAYGNGKVVTVEGPLHKTLERGNRNHGDIHHIEVGGARFTLSKKTFELLTHGATYRLYCIGDDLVSFEPVGSSR